jgi:hypothetical protein
MKQIAITGLVFVAVLSPSGAWQDSTQEARPGGGFISPTPNPFLFEITDENRPDTRYRAAEKRLSEGAFDPAGQSLLTASEQFTKAVFHLPSLSFKRAITYKDEQGDSFTAEWGFEESFLKGSVIMADHPSISYYHFRLPGFRIAAGEDVERLISALVVYNKPPVDVRPERSRFKVTGSPGALTSFSWGFDPYIPSANPYLRHFFILGVSDADSWYVTVGVGKGLTSKYYPVKPFIPERFPPVNELARSWSSEQIRAELRKWLKEDEFGHRQAILLDELVSRGITTEQILDLLGDVPPSREDLYHRLVRLIGALRRNGQGSALRAFFEPALRMYEQKGRPASFAIEALFSSAVRMCSPAFEQQALRVLREGAFLGGPIHYLSACSVSQEAIEAIQAAPEVLGRPTARSDAARSIQQRIDRAARARR